jgi:hypothetical protein
MAIAVGSKQKATMSHVSGSTGALDFCVPLMGIRLKMSGVLVVFKKWCLDNDISFLPLPNLV